MQNNIEISKTNDTIIHELANAIKNKKSENKIDEYVLVCVGVDKVIGDCVGPLVGTKLKNLFRSNNISSNTTNNATRSPNLAKVNIYGTLEKNINYSNIEDYKNKIQNEHKNACIIVIDAALSKSDNIGKVCVSNSKTNLGIGLGKSKIELGDISIKAVVGKDYRNSKNNYKVLQNVSLNTAVNLADKISNGIYETIRNIEV